MSAQRADGSSSKENGAITNRTYSGADREAYLILLAIACLFMAAALLMRSQGYIIYGIPPPNLSAFTNITNLTRVVT